MNRRTRLAACLAACLCAGLVLSPVLGAGGAAASSDDDPKSGLVGVDDLIPISGGARATESPEIKTGRYLDTAPPLDVLRGYAFHRTMPGSTVTFGVTQLGTDVNPAKRLVVRLYAVKPDGSGNYGCGEARFDPDDRATNMPLSTTAGWSWHRQECTDADVLYVVVENASQTQDKVQLVATDTPYELDVWEQPAVTNLDDLDNTFNTEWIYSDADDPQVQAQAGVSPSQAVPLPDGDTAAVDLPLGAISWFYVPVRLGDRLQVLVEAADGGSVAGAGFEARILSPVGGLVDEVDPINDLPGPRATNLVAGPALVSAVTYEVDPYNRFDGAEHSRYSHNTALAGAAGNYLVAVYAQRLSGSSVTSLPVTIKAQTDAHETFPGDEYALPKYADAFPAYAAPTGPEPVAYDPASGDRRAPASTGRSGADLALIGGLGGAAVAFGCVGLVLARRRT